VVKLAQFSTAGVAHYCIGGNNFPMHFNYLHYQTSFYIGIWALL